MCNENITKKNKNCLLFEQSLIWNMIEILENDRWYSEKKSAQKSAVLLLSVAKTAQPWRYAWVHETLNVTTYMLWTLRGVMIAEALPLLLLLAL